MRGKSLIISGAAAIALLVAPTTTEGATPDSQVQNQKQQHIEWVTECLEQGKEVNWDQVSAQLSKMNIDLSSLKENQAQATPKEQTPAPEQAEEPKEQTPAPEQAEEPKEQAPAPEQAEEPKEQAPVPEQKEEQPADTQQVEEPEAQEEAQPTEEAAPEDDAAGEVSSFEEQVVELTNVERSQEGLAPLELDAELSKVAKDKSKDMQQNNYFSHTSPTHGSPFDMMKAYGVDYKSAGENIAMGQGSPEEVVQAWMDSPGHRENIMSSSYTHIGVGHVEEGNYWTQMFISK